MLPFPPTEISAVSGGHYLDLNDDWDNDNKTIQHVNEEEQWLAAVESGNLEQVENCDSELRSVREPSMLTARQRAMGGEEGEGELLEMLDFSRRNSSLNTDKTELTEEEKLLKAQKRKVIESEKKEKIKKKTMDTLLKKKDSKATKQIKTQKNIKDGIPKISYTQNANGYSLSFPSGHEFPMISQPCRSPPKVKLCQMCPNPKRYNSSTTGEPVCSLACYKANLQLVSGPG